MAHPLSVVAAETLTDDRVLTAAEIAETTCFAFDPGAARDLTLPDASSANAGTILFIANTANAAEVITVKSTAQASICTPTQNESAIVWSDGSNWHGLVGAAA